jgi:dipeptidyl aminopeptidase/acylaminoacyl peptidase
LTTEVGGGYFAAMSADGRTVGFVGGSGTPGGPAELFVRDMASGVTTEASVANDGEQANSPVSAASLSADGRFIAFSSWASNLVPGDTNSHGDVFVRDLVSGVTSLVSMALDGGPANGDSGTPAISADGRYVAFESDAGDLVRGDTNESRDVFVLDQLTGKTTRVSVASNGSEGWSPCYPKDMNDNSVALSRDGRVVAFTSDLNRLVRGNENDIPDVFVRDRRSGVTSLVNVASNGGDANGPGSGAIAISAHGRDVAFGSGATNLVPRPRLFNWGVFVRDRLGTRH